MNFIRKNLAGIIMACILIGGGIIYRAEVTSFVRQEYNGFFPCGTPIVYSIGDVDSRFGVSKSKLIDDTKQAIAIWEKESGRKLFTLAETGQPSNLPINLIYDYRQKATVTLHKIDSAITTDKAGYDALQQKYQVLLDSLKTQKAVLQDLITAYEAAKASYDADVEYWNGKGGAPADTYNELQARRADLQNQAATISQKQQEVNTLVNTVNTNVGTLNAMAKQLNLNVQNYNAVGASTGPEFEEGEYVRDGFSQRINIFQFDDQNKFIRVLAHELGHALGLDHNNNPKSIMYAYNEGVNEKLTVDDLNALKKRCHL